MEFQISIQIFFENKSRKFHVTIYLIDHYLSDNIRDLHLKITLRKNLHVLPTNFQILMIKPGVLITLLHFIMRTHHFSDP